MKTASPSRNARKRISSRSIASKPPIGRAVNQITKAKDAPCSTVPALPDSHWKQAAPLHLLYAPKELRTIRAFIQNTARHLIKGADESDENIYQLLVVMDGEEQAGLHHFRAAYVNLKHAILGFHTAIARTRIEGEESAAPQP